MKKTTDVNSYKHEKNFSSRFREERKRAKLGQEEVARICGVSSRTVIGWEKGAKIPGEALASLMAHGVDAIYVLSGRRIDDPRSMLLSTDEVDLIYDYRALNEEERRDIRRIIGAYAHRAFERGTNPFVRRRKRQDSEKE